MWIRLSLIGLAALNLLAAQEQLVRLGRPAPELRVSDVRGNEAMLSEYRGKSVVVLMAGGETEGRLAEIRRESQRRLGKLDTEVVSLTGAKEAATILVDAGGVVRRVLAGRVLAGGEVVDFVSVWREGKAVFEASCARCHGVDGALDICLDVKPLVGIGRRYTAAEIREKLRIGELNEEQVMVRGQFYKRAEVEAVLAYISGL